MKSVSEMEFLPAAPAGADDLAEARRIAERMMDLGAFRVRFGGAVDPQLAGALREVCLMTARLRAGRLPYWLTLAGTNGCGKTHLANWLGRRFAEVFAPGLLPRVWTVAELKDAYLGGGWKLLSGLANEPWLVLDELGAERVSEAFREGFVSMLNARLGKWTVITTNLSEREIEAAYSPRVTSRMVRQGNVHYRLEVADYATRRAEEERSSQ